MEEPTSKSVTIKEDPQPSTSKDEELSEIAPPSKFPIFIFIKLHTSYTTVLYCIAQNMFIFRRIQFIPKIRSLARVYLGIY